MVGHTTKPPMMVLGAGTNLIVIGMCVVQLAVLFIQRRRQALQVLTDRSLCIARAPETKSLHYLWDGYYCHLLGPALRINRPRLIQLLRRLIFTRGIEWMLTQLCCFKLF